MFGEGSTGFMISCHALASIALLVVQCSVQECVSFATGRGFVLFSLLPREWRRRKARCGV